MCSKNIFFTLLGFWVELPQILGLGFSVCTFSALRTVVLGLEALTGHWPSLIGTTQIFAGPDEVFRYPGPRWRPLECAARPPAWRTAACRVGAGPSSRAGQGRAEQPGQVWARRARCNELLSYSDAVPKALHAILSGAVQHERPETIDQPGTCQRRGRAV